MVHQYIEKELLRKNRGVYFKKGKWIFHVLFLTVTALAFTLSANDKDAIKLNGVDGFLPRAITLSLFIIFFYTYCLYLIPACFKRGHYKKFWIALIGMLLTFPLINLGLQKALMQLPSFHYLSNITTLEFTKATYKSFFSYFLGFTSLLYLMELLEEVRTSKEIVHNSRQLQATELQLIKTRMDPDFVTRSLDGITNLAARKSDDAPDSVIGFSDILRYRLYRSAAPLVPLEEELQQLGNLVRFHNAIHTAGGFCTLEIEGDPGAKTLPPLSFINITEPLLNLYQPGKDWSLLLYLLIEPAEIQAAVELYTGNPQLQTVCTLIENNLDSIFGTAATFTIETQGHLNSIRICLPIQNSSTASL